MMDLFATHTWVLAQEGSEAAVNVIENALQLTQSTIESWNDTWAQTITPSSALWVDYRGLLQRATGPDLSLYVHPLR
jgi:hypothetical protein